MDSDINTKVLFLHLLLKANFEEVKYKGKVIEKGSFATTLPKLSNELNLTINEVRTALKHLKSTGEIEIKTTNKESVIKVLKYSAFQGCELPKPQTNHRQSTDYSQPINVPIEKEDKEEQEIKKRPKRDKAQPHTFIPPTVDEVAAYCQERQNGIDAKRFVNFYEAKNWMVGKNKMVKWQAAVRSWENNDAKQDKSSAGTDAAGGKAENKPKYGNVV